MVFDHLMVIVAQKRAEIGTHEIDTKIALLRLVTTSFLGMPPDAISWNIIHFDWKNFLNKSS